MAMTLDLDLCRKRQARLIEQMKAQGVELLITNQAAPVQWLTGARFGPVFRPAAALSVEGWLVLVVPVNTHRETPSGFAADEVVPYEGQWYSTMRSDQGEASAQVLLSALGKRTDVKAVGVEFSSFGPYLAQYISARLVDFEPTLYRLRRKKDADEMKLLRKAIEATANMYARAREIICPGINEIEVYNSLQAVGVETFGEPMTYFGQDFQCNARGGPPRDRKALAGELYILDLGAGYRGYYSDNARVISVDGNPTNAQQRAWECIVGIFDIVKAHAKPGASCKALFEKAKEHLAVCEPWRFDHHLGHGVGLYPHEAPHLNPYWDDVFEVGDLFTAEPGLYHDELKSGIRLENNYLVTESGVELLTPFTLQL